VSAEREQQGRGGGGGGRGRYQEVCWVVRWFPGSFAGTGGGRGEGDWRAIQTLLCHTWMLVLCGGSSHSLYVRGMYIHYIRSTCI